MAATGLDLDRLALYLKTEIEERDLSVRGAASQVGCSPATLGRLLQGSRSQNVPDSTNILRAVSWLGRQLGEFTRADAPPKVGFADVEIHLRALPGLRATDADALVAMVKAAYNAGVGTKKTPRR